MRTCDRKFFNKQITRCIQHFAFAERKFLVSFENEEVPKHSGNLENRSCFDLLGVFAIASIPGLLIELNLPLSENLVNFRYHLFVDNLSQPYGLNVIDRNHDFHIAVQDAQRIKSLLGAGNALTPYGFYLSHAVCWIDNLIAHFKHAEISTWPR